MDGRGTGLAVRLRDDLWRAKTPTDNTAISRECDMPRRLGHAPSWHLDVDLPRPARFRLLRSQNLLRWMSPSLNRSESLTLSALSLACIAVLLSTFQGDGEPLVASIALSGLAFALCYALIRWLGNAFVRVGFKGRDMAKLKKTEMCILPCPGLFRAPASRAHVLLVRKPWALSARLCICSSSSSSSPGPSTKTSSRPPLAVAIAMLYTSWITSRRAGCCIASRTPRFERMDACG